MNRDALRDLAKGKTPAQLRAALDAYFATGNGKAAIAAAPCLTTAEAISALLEEQFE